MTTAVRTNDRVASLILQAVLHKDIESNMHTSYIPFLFFHSHPT